MNPDFTRFQKLPSLDPGDGAAKLESEAESKPRKAASGRRMPFPPVPRAGQGEGSRAVPSVPGQQINSLRA
jgi:hypothetical protein